MNDPSTHLKSVSCSLITPPTTTHCKHCQLIILFGYKFREFPINGALQYLMSRRLHYISVGSGRIGIHFYVSGQSLRGPVHVALVRPLNTHFTRINNICLLLSHHRTKVFLNLFHLSLEEGLTAARL